MLTLFGEIRCKQKTLNSFKSFLNYHPILYHYLLLNNVSNTVFEYSDMPHMPILQASVIVAMDGGHVEIVETGVTLTIPAEALLEEHEIYMKIIPQPCDSGGSMSFANNSAVIVELLPNNLKFLKPVVLQLPHCLQLRKGYDNSSVRILASHHEGGKIRLTTTVLF